MVCTSGCGDNCPVSTAGCHCNSNSFLVSKRDLKEEKELVLSEFIITSCLLRCLCEVSRWEKLLNHHVKGAKVLKKTLCLSDGC